MPKKKKKAKLEILDPQQVNFFRWYTDPKSPTYGNAKQSALKAGYSKSYAETIAFQAEWISETLGQESMVRKAERNLDNYLDLNTNGNEKLEKIKSDISKFVAKNGSNGKWSETQKIESKNLNVNIDLESDKAIEITKSYEEEMKSLLEKNEE